jgi:hypothetical protein
MNVATARHTASDSVNFQMARMQRTVQATNDTVITMNEIILTSFGFRTPRRSVSGFSVRSVSIRSFKSLPAENCNGSIWNYIAV